jgi:hypothetical protein
MGLGDGASISFQAHNETMVAARSDDAWMYTASGRKVSTSVKGFLTDGRLRWCSVFNAECKQNPLTIEYPSVTKRQFIYCYVITSINNMTLLTSII